ncbi:MAG: glycosyltransferase [Pacificimonas sp.]
MLRVLTLSSLYPNAAQPNLGGFVARQTEKLAARDDVDVTVIAPVQALPLPLPDVLRSRLPYAGQRDVPQEDTRGGIAVHHPRYRSWPVIGWRLNADAIAATVIPLAKRLHAEAPFDVIDCEYFFPDSVAALRLSRALGLPFSVKARGSDIRYWGGRHRARRQMMGAGRHANGMLAVSQALRDDMVQMGLPRERIAVHYTGIDMDRFHPGAAPKASEPRLIAAGNLVPVKRTGLLIEMMAHLPDVRLDIIGHGAEHASLERQIERLDLSSRVTLLGRLPHDELPARMAAAHMLVHASASEGLANVWLEALASGTPVVSTNVGGAAEVVTEGVGTLIPPDTNAVRLATAVRGLLDNLPAPDVTRAAAEPFSWAANTQALYDHLTLMTQKVKAAG